VANGDVARKAVQVSLVEALGYQPQGDVAVEAPAVRRGDSRALLAPVLQREEAKKGEPGYILAGCVDAYDPACFSHRASHRLSPAWGKDSGPTPTTLVDCRAP
jgi:hypothetical protein